MMRITLIRHGKPAFELKGKARGRELAEIAKSYDNSGIVGSPPSNAIRAAQECSFVVCSHLPRSVESAKALGCPDIHVSDPLFCETGIPYFRSGSIPLPLSVWVVLLRLMWLFGFSSNGESFADARTRAKQATSTLVQLAESHQSVLFVGHGFINYFIAKELRKRGWLGPSKPKDGYWGYGSYECVTI